MPAAAVRLTRSRDAAGGVVVRLGVPLLDEYLEFLAGRCRPNTVRAVAYDLNGARSERRVHDVSAEAPCARFHKPSPKKRPLRNRDGKRGMPGSTIRTWCAVSKGVASQDCRAAHPRQLMRQIQRPPTHRVSEVGVRYEQG